VENALERAPWKEAVRQIKRLGHTRGARQVDESEKWEQREADRFRYRFQVKLIKLTCLLR
jgi:hypothetical protein